MACLWLIPAAAQVNREVLRIVSPFAAGGGREVLARTFLNEFSAALGETVIIDNRPGAGGVTGTVYVAKAAPDGHTLLLTATNHNVAPLIESPPPYEPTKQFSGVATIGTGANVLMANSQTPFTSVDAFVKYAKANPGTLNFASAGIGSGSHLAMAYLMGLANIDLVHIPYKSTNAAATEMFAGRVQVSFVTAAEVLPLLKEPRVRVLGVSTPQVSRFLPGVPTIAQSGVPGFSYESWWGLLAPAGTPRPVIEKLNAAMGKALTDPAVAERLSKLTIEPRIMKPDEFDEFLRKDVDTARRMLKCASVNIRQ